MPLYKTIKVTEETTVLIWKIEESEATLKKGIELTPHCAKRFSGMKSEMHRRGFLSIRHLMAIEGYTDHDLYYDAEGKPHLQDGTFISITHSHHFTGIILSKTKHVGIDIEMQREKILKIAHKFTPIEEYRTLANSDALMRKLTIVWGVKESLYKIYAQPGLSFLQHINVTDFALTATESTAEILYKGDLSHYHVFFNEFEGFTCVHAFRK